LQDAAASCKPDARSKSHQIFL